MKESLDALAIARRLPSDSQQLTNDTKSARENVLDDLRSLLRDLSTTAPARGGASSHRNKDAFKDLYRKVRCSYAIPHDDFIYCRPLSFRSLVGRMSSQ